jgi:pentatricopeptide repeat protein
MRPARAVLGTFTATKNALASTSSFKIAPRLLSRGISTTLLREPTPELITRLKERATSRQLKHLLAQSAEAQSPLVPVVVDILRGRDELEYRDYTFILRDLRYEISDSRRARSIAETQESLQEVLREMRETGKHLDNEGEGEMVRINVLLGVQDAMEAAAETIKRWGEWKNYSVYQWNAYIEYLIKMEDETTIASVLNGWKNGEMDPPIRAKEYLIIRNLQRSIDSKSTITPIDVAQAVETIEKDTKSSSVARLWATAIRHLLSQVPGSLDTALEVYSLARDKGVETDTSLARELIGPLSALNPPRLEEALSIYSDYLGFNLPYTTTDSRDPTIIFSSLLYACAKSPSHSATALRILNDMRARNLSFPPLALGALATHLTRSAPDHQTAFNLYAHLYALDSNALNRRTYESILSGFIIHSTPKSPVAPTNLYLEIIRDMQKAGFRIGSYSITSLLTSYGLQATTLSKRANAEDAPARQVKVNGLLRGISELHTMIKLDPLVEVDIPLLNSLMDAYNRVGAYAEAFEVWDELVERRSRHPSDHLTQYSPSVNIMLDTCGYSQSLLRANKAWAWATRWRLNTDKRNWDAYVECLCRCGRIDDAYEVVRRMKNQEGIPDPSVETIMLLVKFSWKNRRDFEEAKEKVQREFPEWWEGVREILEMKRSDRPAEYR